MSQISYSMAAVIDNAIFISIHVRPIYLSQFYVVFPCDFLYNLGE
jgi:hypothetical protein